jgi:hypothetical protein
VQFWIALMELLADNLDARNLERHSHTPDPEDT